MSASSSHPHIDMVLHNAQVLTVDSSFNVAQALAIKNGRIVAVGSNDDVLSTVGGRTRRIDLGGRTVVPGFTDAHAHMDREGLRRAYPGLQDCRSISDVQQVVRGAAADRKTGEWVVLMPLGEPPFHCDPQQTLAEGRYPDRRDLDEAAPDNPVWIRSPLGFWSGTPPFVHVLNSAGLQACGITRDTVSPTSKLEIERDAETGELTGRILEWGATIVGESSILSGAPRFSHEIRVEGLKRAMRLSVAAGTTSVYEGHGIAAEVHRAYKELHDRGEMLVRAYLPISPPPWDSVAEAEKAISDWAHYCSGPGFGNEWLKVGGFYLNYRGRAESAAINRAAAPYAGWFGFIDQYIDRDLYRELCRLAARYRLRVGTSVIPGVDEVLSIWEEIDREYSIRDLRWVLVHGTEMVPQRDFPRIQRLGLVVTTQPGGEIYRSGLSMLRKFPDENQVIAHRDYIEAGIPWAISTDNKPYWMLFALWVAVARREQQENRVIGPRQRVTVPQALRALTYMGAYVSFEEHNRGSLEVGKLADLLVLSDDPLRVDEDRLRDLRVELTMVGGRAVHGDGSLVEPD